MLLTKIRENVTLSTSNSASIYYFAVEAYAFDIAVPGEGCVGQPKEEEHDHDDDATSTSSAAESATATATSAAVETSAATTTEAVPEATSAAPEAEGECHTHDDGVVHCT